MKYSRSIPVVLRLMWCCVLSRGFADVGTLTIINSENQMIATNLVWKSSSVSYGVFGLTHLTSLRGNSIRFSGKWIFSAFLRVCERCRSGKQSWTLLCGQIPVKMKIWLPFFLVNTSPLQNLGFEKRNFFLCDAGVVLIWNLTRFRIRYVEHIWFRYSFLYYDICFLALDACISFSSQHCLNRLLLFKLSKGKKPACIQVRCTPMRVKKSKQW